MEVLLFLQELRNPICNAFFSVVTLLGDETFFILIGLLFFWCINKKEGYYLLTVGFVGTVLNQFLKLAFRIPRPWLRDPSLTTVGDSMEAATGYSFPSGHTQVSFGTFGGIARWNKRWTVRVVCITLCGLVGFSRMYLGVHTPADVLVSASLAVVLVFLFYPLMRRLSDGKKGMRILLLFLLVLTGAYMAFVHLYRFPADVDADNLRNGTENAYKMMGCLSALWVGYEVDVGYLHFETKAVWWAQLLKLVLGLLPLLAIKALLKQPLYDLFENDYLADGVRYFLLSTFASAVWPMTFGFWNRLGRSSSVTDK